MKRQGRQTKQHGGAKLLVLLLACASAMSCLVFVWAQHRQPPTQRERPRRATTAANAPGKVIRVEARGDFQAALNTAQPGDTIVLAAGATYTGPFTLPRKSGESFINIESSQLAALPAAGERVSPAHSALMPRIVTPGSGQSALKTAAGAHHFRFTGIEFAPATATAFVYHVIALGDVGAAQDMLDEVPHHLVFDRCYIHAFPTQDLRRGIMLNSAHTEIINCHISDFKAKGVDAQA
ncbi:MAG TPA: hypothetical protein VNA19_14615, partial [Pyrinomonadaceae bacterium]|nr:hypothetical protein [Pyrinomonadaceae bacterium]